MRGGSIYFFLPGTYSIMNGANRRMRNREPWKQKHVNPIWDLHRYIYVMERLTQKAWEQLRDLGIGKDVKSTQAVCCSPPCAQCGGGGGSLGVGGIGSNGNRLQEVGRVCVRLQTKIPFLAQAL